MSYLDNPGNNLLRTNMELDRLDSAKVYLPNANTNLPHPIAHAAVSSSFVIAALLGAERARTVADSYRGFRVGACALASYESLTGVRSHMFVHGANMKPIQGLEQINVHAEHTILSKIESKRKEDESARVSILAVVGDLQADQQSGHETHTLHPCGVCREQFEDPHSPVDDDTLIVTANESLTTVEWFDTNALKQLHDHHDDSGIGRAVFGERSLMFNVPDWYLEVQERGLVAPPFEDSAEEIAAEKEFDDKVKFPVFNYIIRRALDRITDDAEHEV